MKSFRILLACVFIGLLGSLWGLWQTRFERVPGARPVTLADLRNQVPAVNGVEWMDCADGSVEVRVQSGRRGSAVAARYELPFSFPVDLMHVRFRMSAENLRKGKEIWQDGRAMVEWLSPDGAQRLAIDPIGSVCNSETLTINGVVIGSETKPGRAVLRLENLGASGSFTIAGFEGIEVRERMSWCIGKWMLLGGFAFWFYAVIRCWPSASRSRAAIGAVVCCIVATQLVVPGPWKSQRPMGTDFSLGDSRSGPSVVSQGDCPGMVLNSGATEPEGKIKSQGSWILLVKLAFVAARPLLHALLLFGPTLVLLCLVGRGPALWLMSLASVSIEAAQYCFGYGFDRTDVFDLTNDAIGMVVALLVHAWMVRRWGWLACTDSETGISRI